MFTELALLGGLLYQTNKASNMDEQALKKNIKASTKMAEAQYKVEQTQNHLIERLKINAIRKNAILSCHLKLFKEQYSVISQINFKDGRGIKQLKQIDTIDKQLTKYVSQPTVASGAIITEPHLMITFALGGIGGLLLVDSKQNLELAKRNMSQANAMAAQADALCIAYQGIANHIDIITDLLEKLGFLYIKSINTIKDILQKNGFDESKYSDNDLETINISMQLTKVIYKIIDTPAIDNNGVIEQKSIVAINSGQELLNKIDGGKF